MRKLKIAAGVVVVLLLFVRLVLLTATAVPDQARFAIDLNALREAAGPIEASPDTLHAERIAGAPIPSGLAVAGSSMFSQLILGQYGLLLRYADGTTVMLDPVHSRATNKKNGDYPYDDQGWERQEKAIATVSAIAVTHEHYDHLGGAADSAHFFTFGDKLKLTAAQRKKLSVAGVDRDLSGPATLESGPEGSVHKVAAGVVALTAAGHTPGSQMLYLRLKGGAEFLLVGDIVWNELALQLPAPRARLVSLIMGEDADAITHQLRAIIDFKKANPTVDVLVAHDVPAMERRFAAGTIGKGF